MQQIRNTDKISHVGDIPLIITDEHHHVLPYWIDSGMKQGQLLHVDAHSDMWDCVNVDIVSINPSNKKYSRNSNNYGLNCANFICPVVHLGIVSSIYWLNPHSSRKRLQDLDGYTTEGKPNFGTRIDEHNSIRWEYYRRMPWRTLENTSIEDFFKTIAINSMQEHITIEKPYMLDVDLDAFCCDRDIENVSYNYTCSGKGAKNYEKRIEDTIEVLTGIKRKPDLITIARSQGRLDQVFSCPYVPPDLVDEVQRAFLERVHQLYDQ